ncbi:hypothetical protein CR513_18579, partial [Mucuna pruriens]
MTLFPSHFTSYSKASKKQLITIANGDHLLIDLVVGRTIGIAKEQGGLYYLQHTKIGSNPIRRICLLVKGQP